MNRHLTGVLGEETAAKYYRRLGYDLLAANYRTRQGEIDLIVQKDGCLVFVEVKARKMDAVVTGAEAVNAAKQHKLTLAAQSYLASCGAEPNAVRFDVVEVTCVEDRVIKIQCIENAFEAQ